MACLIVLLWWLGSTPVQAGALAERVAAFPNWRSFPPVEAASGDLIYPAWLEGTWRVDSTLVDLVAPLAPAIVTPGFDSNRASLNQPIEFEVRFGPSPMGAARAAKVLPAKSQGAKSQGIVADRAFNGLNLARAYLGERTVLAVKVDPSNPNRQITLLRNDRQLISKVTGRAVETPAIDQFITTEVFQQVFRGSAQPYLNQVETTTAYRWVRGANQDPLITADQLTAVYLSPQDPAYFRAGQTPVALYRYRLEFLPVTPAKLSAKID